MRSVTLVATLFMLASALEAQAPQGSSFGSGLFWGFLCDADECVERIDGGGAEVRVGRSLGDRVSGDVSVVYWYGSTRDETVRRASLFVAGRFYPSRSASAFIKAGGGVSWDLDEGPGHPAGLVGVGWDIRGWLGGTVTPFLDATFFGPPDPVPTLRLVSGGVELSWPF